MHNQTAFSACREFLGQHRHAVKTQLKRMHRAGDRRWEAQHRDAGTTSPPREISHRSCSPSKCVSNWINTRSCSPRKCLASVPASCSRVDKWMKPSRKSSADPANAPLRHASSHAARVSDLEDELSRALSSLVRTLALRKLFLSLQARCLRARRRVARLSHLHPHRANDVRRDRCFSEIASVARRVVMLPS